MKRGKHRRKLLTSTLATIAASGVALGMGTIFVGSGSNAATSGTSWVQSFEGGTGNMQSWYDTNGVGRTSATAHNGSWSLDIDGQDSWGIEESWPGHHTVTPGDVWTYSGWVKVSAGTAQDVDVTVFFVDSSSNGLGEADVATVSAKAGGWTRFTRNVTVPDNAATAGFRFTGPTAGHIYVDGLKGTLVSSGTGGTGGTPTTSPSPSDTPTTQSPSPTTTTSPSPSPTTTPQGGECTNPTYTWRNGEADNVDNNYYADSDLWNPVPGLQQTMNICSHASWNVTDYVPTNADQGSVKAYPNIHKDWHNWSTNYEPPLSSVNSIPSTYASISSGIGTYDAAWDIWLNNFNLEIMIWTDNNNQIPAGDVVANNVTLGGKSWDVWATADNTYIAFVPTNGQKYNSGSFDLKDFLQYLIDNNREPANATLSQADYGIEICSTDGKQSKFSVTDFSVATVPDYTPQY